MNSPPQQEFMMFEPIERIENIYGDGVGYVELWPSWYANQSEETRVEAVSKIAALSYGNDAAKNPQDLYDSLKQSKHSSLFEFVCQSYAPVWYVHNKSVNMRISPSLSTRTEVRDELHCDTTAETFALIKMKIPIFVFRQLIRHRNFSTLEMSRRYVKDTKRPFEYYKYDEDKAFYDTCTLKYQDAIIKGMLAQEARKFIPVGAYTELFWMNNWHPIDGLKNMFELRLDKQHTQPETVTVTESIYTLIQKHQPALFEKVKV